MVLRCRLRQSVSALQQILCGHAIAWYWGASQVKHSGHSPRFHPAISCHAQFHHVTMHLAQALGGKLAEVPVRPEPQSSAHAGSQTAVHPAVHPAVPKTTCENCRTLRLRRHPVGPFPLRNRFSLRDGLYILYSCLRFTRKFPLNSGYSGIFVRKKTSLSQCPSCPSCPGSKCYKMLTVDSCWLHVLRSNLQNLSDSPSPFWNPSDCGNNLLHRGHSPLTSEKGNGSGSIHLHPSSSNKTDFQRCISDSRSVDSLLSYILKWTSAQVVLGDRPGTDSLQCHQMRHQEIIYK